MTNYTKYCNLREELVQTRIKNNGEESPEEDEILDEMDAIWWDLSREERNQIEELYKTQWQQ